MADTGQKSAKILDAKALAALCIALMADFIQIILWPIFFEGGFSPVDDALDFGVAAIMTSLLGWNWVFLPTALAKLVPVVDVAPFWTGAVAFVLWGRSRDKTLKPAKTDGVFAEVHPVNEVLPPPRRP